MNAFRTITHGFFFVLLLAALSSCGDAAPPDRFPRKGWGPMTQMEGSHLDPAITNDYKAYIAALPQPDKFQAEQDYNQSYSEDGSGQIAIIIKVSGHGDHWHHVLVYDRSHKRIQTMKYIAGHYMS